MGYFVCQSLTMKVVAVLVTIALHQAAADWSGSGEFSCYGHVSTDVTSPEGGDHLGEGTLNCILSSGEAAPLDLRQCSSSPTVEQSLRFGRGTTMIGTVGTGRCPMPPARGRSGTRGMTWALATALLTKLRRASPAVATVIVLETLSALAAEPVQISNKNLSIFSLTVNMQKD